MVYTRRRLVLCEAGVQRARNWVRASRWVVVCTGVWGLRAWRGQDCRTCHAMQQHRGGLCGVHLGLSATPS